MAELLAWVDEVAALTRPDRIRWVSGSAQEHEELLAEMVERGTLLRLNDAKRPNSFLARSDPDDVARLESRTFICSTREEDAGPTNNWVAPDDMRATLSPLFEGSMRGRTMYVVPFSMGKVGGPISQLGVQLTDSPYAVASIEIMTRVGDEVVELIAEGTPFVRTVHSVGAPLVEGADDVPWPSNPEKYIVHFPDSLEVWSFGSGYGGNAILAKKCYALRIASVLGRDQGWMAEHMLLIRVVDPQGRAFHVAAAFPSACGKTNLAMLRPTIPGWSVETLGDDITWIRPGEDGRLWAINPEAGFFGVAPGTGAATNVTAVETLRRDVIFTNVALTDDGDVWWEGLTDEPPAHLIDWRGDDWTPQSGRPAAHPNSRFTVSAAQAPSIAADWEEAVPLDAILFGGRRATNVPLVVEAFDWEHGVFLGSTISSERTAAAEGTVGELRRDPFAMMPFCGYNMADYFAHWVEMGRRVTAPPAIFQVNWFRKGADGRFLWPGFGENARVIEWIVRRLTTQTGAVASPIGRLPEPGSLNLDGIEVPPPDLEELFAIDPDSWLAETDLVEEFFDTFGDRVPAELRAQLAALRRRLRAAKA
ncbi:phosphoenolpyruvate carboxykinase (GTP) [Microbacterium sp. Marseille-Q6965]|uniref:phosphoenolpyruvate carboxykinase (GTP) n=1 Tax=Microbacterium sp. Marseille-Q6965 TaxID=2965072 RepID=UPI0021B83BAD|nr:phosphoenolpyruvate carboxykinase (GTP) [Microbacterium sp. Marseille-Q6965]